jgi:hypothetical protein
MPALYSPPAGLKDFDLGNDPQLLYQTWSKWISDQTQASADYPAWYSALTPPAKGNPVTQAPPWQGIPRAALLLNNNDVLAAAQAVENAVEFGSGADALLVNQPPFFDVNGQKVSGLKYRPQDEYLEWVTKTDPDGVVREILLTCEGPEYWNVIAANDQGLLMRLYSDITGLPVNQLDVTKLYFQELLTHREVFAGGKTLTFNKGDYNPYNEYNLSFAVHLTQGANTLGAEIALAMAGSLIWGSPPKTNNPDLICCAQYGDPNRFSDPTIGKEVNDLARQRMSVTLRDPIGLYIASILPANFTDWNGSPVPNIGDFLVPVRKSDDGTMILRAAFRVPAGIMKNGIPARVGDYSYLGKPISTGGQVAQAITMHLFAQALPGAPQQQSQKCTAHACNSPSHPGYVIPTDINKPCPAAHAMALAEHMNVVASPKKGKPIGNGRLKFSRVAAAL